MFAANNRCYANTSCYLVVVGCYLRAVISNPFEPVIAEQETITSYHTRAATDSASEGRTDASYSVIIDLGLKYLS